MTFRSSTTRAVGGAVGSCEGATVNNAEEGAREGSRVGSRVGFIEGRGVGSTLGLAVATSDFLGSPLILHGCSSADDVSKSFFFEVPGVLTRRLLDNAPHASVNRR